MSTLGHAGRREPAPTAARGLQGSHKRPTTAGSGRSAESEAAAIVTKVTAGNMSNCRFGRVGPSGSAAHRGGQDDIDVLENLGTFAPGAAARRGEEPLGALLVVQALAGDQLRVVLDGADIAPHRGDPVAARGAVVQHEIDQLADGDSGREV